MVSWWWCQLSPNGDCGWSVTLLHVAVKIQLVTPDFHQRSCKNFKVTIRCWTTVDRRMLDPTKNDTPHPRAKEEPQKDGRRGKIMLKSNSIPARDVQRAQTNLVHIRTQRPQKEWARTVFEDLLWRYGSAVACHRGSGCSKPGYGISPRGGGSHSLHHRAIRNFTRLGKQTLAGDKQKPVCTRTQEKGSVTPKETAPDLPVSVQESLEKA